MILLSDQLTEGLPHTAAVWSLKSLSLMRHSWGLCPSLSHTHSAAHYSWIQFPARVFSPVTLRVPLWPLQTLCGQRFLMWGAVCHFVLVHTHNKNTSAREKQHTGVTTATKSELPCSILNHTQTMSSVQSQSPHHTSENSSDWSKVLVMKVWSET